MKSINMISTIVLIFISSIYANNGIYNQIENDHRIRNFAFIGPFPKTFNGDSLIKIINSDQFSMDNNVKYEGKSYKWIKSHPANGSLGFHNLWHLYPEIQPGDIVVGYAIVNSIKKQKIISEIMNFWYCQADIYINSKIIFDQDKHPPGKLIRGNLNSGNNNICLKIKAIGEPGINLAIYPESRIEISGKVLDKNGNTVPFANVRFYEINKEKWYGSSTDIKGEYSFQIFPVDEDPEYFAFAFGGENKRSHKIISGLKRGDRKKLNFTVLKKPKIKGKVFNLDGKGRQYGVVVQAVGLNSKGEEDDRYLATTHTSSEGQFEFSNLSLELKYHLRIHGKDDFIYYKDKNDKKKIFDLSISNNGYEDIEMKVPRLSKGTWSQITYTDGMQSNYTMSSLIDNENKLWFGSYTGISIYDGQEIININQHDGLPQKPILQIFQDNKNRIWAAAAHPQWRNDGGLTLFKDDKIEKVFSEQDGLNGNSVTAIDQDVNGNILIGGNGGFTIYDGKNFKTFNGNDGIPFGYVNTIMVEGTNIWLGTLDGLVLYNGKKFRVYNSDDGLSNQWINCIRKGPNGKIWIGTNAGLSIFDGTKFSVLWYKHGLANNQINDVYFDKSGNAIISTGNGVFRYNGKTFVRLDPKSAGYNFELNAGMEINRSKDGIYWFTDWSGSGVVKYDPRSIINTTEADSFPNIAINDIKVDKNRNLWIATNGRGLIQLVDGKIKNQFKIEDGLRNNTITSLDIDVYGNIWMATSAGLSKYDGRKIKTFTKEDGLPTNDIKALFADDRGFIWFTSFYGLTRFDGSESITYDEEQGLTKERVWGVDIAKGGPKDVIVLGIQNYGISIFDGKRFTNYTPESGLQDNRITCVDIDSEGSIWLGTDGSGVVKFDGDVFTQYTRKDGVANPEVWNMYIDDYDRVWIGTYGGGVGVFDGETWGTLDSRDGLVGNGISSLTSFGNSVYWFGSGDGKGISEYRPSSSPGFVRVKEIVTSNNRYKIGKNLSQVAKSVTDNRLNFIVNAANYNTHKDKQKFRYRIKEISDEWSKPSIKPVFEWVPNNAGDFTFEVQSIDRDLNYSNPASASFTVIYPWYKEPKTAVPFWGVILLIISLSGYSTNNYIKQRQVSLQLREEAAEKDRIARENLEEKNTQLQESQKAAEAANEAKSTFLANMSHELRTPLNAIIGYSEMLIEDAEDENEDFVPDLEKIHGSGKHLLGLINDILDLSKVESGKMELFLEEFDLLNALNEVKSTVKPLVEKNKNKLEIDFNCKNNSIKSDVTKIRQILLNLLSNASKFTKEGVIAVIVDDLDDKNIQFKVKDSGIGMTKDQVDKVFKPFTQADEKTTRKFGGTGLGLTITKMFTEMMGGRIELESKVGTGTTFIVTLPRIVEDKKVKEKKSDEKNIKDGFKILVVDDDENAQDMMKRFLEKQNYVVIQAMSGEEGLNLAAKEKPDLITLDVMMPEMDGWEVLTALQNNDVTKNIPTIMLTMANEPDLGFSLGATDYLTKPVNWEELSGVLSKHQIEADSQTILIVEDDETTRTMLRKSLESNNFKVREAVNGKEGLEKVERSKPGLIILDLMMPEMDGFEFSEELRKNKDWIDIPVVVVTAKDLTKEDHERLKGNVETIMQKGSYSKKELLSEVGTRIELLKDRS